MNPTHTIRTVTIAIDTIWTDTISPLYKEISLVNLSKQYASS